MRIYLFISLFFFGIVMADSPVLHSKAKSVIKPENIQVLIEENVPEALLEVKGAYYIYNPLDGSKISSGILSKRFLVHAQDSGLKWGEFFPNIHQIYIVPRSADGSILVNGIQYDGSIAVYNIDNNISVINDVSIEQYIKSTLSPQFFVPLDREAMAAIAIVARTEAYYLIDQNKDKYWHVDAQKSRYLGASTIRPNSEVEKAVDETTHLILTNNKLSPFSAKWTEHCAGKTAPYASIFRKEGNAPNTVVESTIALFNRDESSWTFQINKEKLASIFNLSKLKEVDLFIDKPSQKAYAVRLKAEQEEKNIDFLSFQKKIGSDLIQSNDFTITSEGDSFIFTGFGKGDGVGLCLYSADILSQKGKDALSILETFYPDTHLVNLSAFPQYDKKNIEVKR